jgi:hypothetical protein
MAYDAYGHPVKVENLTVIEIKRYLRTWEGYMRTKTFGEIVNILDGSTEFDGR